MNSNKKEQDGELGALIEQVVAQRRRVANMVDADPSKRTEKQLLRAMESRMNELTMSLNESNDKPL